MRALLAAACAMVAHPADAITTYELDLIATDEQLRAGGLQEFPVILREMTFGGPGSSPFFGKYPVKAIAALVKDPSRNSTPLDFIPASGFDVEVKTLNTADASGFTFELTADPPVSASGSPSAIAGFKEWQIGKIQIRLGPRIVLDDGEGGVPDGVLCLEIEFVGGGIIIQPTDDPTSGSRYQLQTNGKRYECSNFEVDLEQVIKADGEQFVIDEAMVNVGVLRAVNGGELTIGAEIVNFGIIEALSGSRVTNQGFGMRQLKGAGTSQTFDDRLVGGTFRAVDGILNVAPDGFILAGIEAATLELSGPLSETNFFDDASGRPGDFRTGGRGLSIADGGVFRLDDGVRFNVFDISLFTGGRLEVFGTSEVTTFVGVSGHSGIVAGDGTIIAQNLDLNVGRVDLGRSDTQPGILRVQGNASFQVQSQLLVNLNGNSTFDALDVSGRLFIQDGEKDGAVLLIDVADQYVPALGHRFTIATAGEIVGKFDIVCDNSPRVDFMATVDEGTLVIETVPDPLGDFRQRFGLDLEGSDDFEDKSGNGIPNLFYYAFNLGDPAATHFDRSRLPGFELAPGGGELVFSFVRPVRSGCLSFHTLTTSDLANWVAPGSLGFEFLPTSESAVPVGTDFLRVRQTYSIQDGDDARFYSLRVDLMNVE